jgi:hypothetical protein
VSSFAPAELVEGVQRQPLPYGLFSVLTPRPEGDARWMNGIKWETLTCDPVSGRSGPGCTDVADENGDFPEGVVGLPKALDRNAGEVGEAAAFAVYGHFNCSPVGFTPQVAQERATMHLQAREQARVEQAIQTGDLGNTPNFTDAADLTGGTPVSALEAAAMLEDWIAAEYGSLGVLHGTRGGIDLLDNSGSLHTSGSRLLTRVDTPVVAGAGYRNVSPAGVVTAGVWWLYVTPALFGYQSEIITSSETPGDLLDRGSNDLYAIAERGYVIGWDPCGVAAAAFTLT